MYYFSIFYFFEYSEQLCIEININKSVKTERDFLFELFGQLTEDELGELDHISCCQLNCDGDDDIAPFYKRICNENNGKIRFSEFSDEYSENEKILDEYINSK